MSVSNLYSGGDAMSNLTLIPVGGLANRMKAIDAAASMTNELKYSLRIIWFKDEGLNCLFKELFQPIDLPYVELKEAKMFDSIVLDRPRKHNLWIPKLFQSFLFDECIYEDKATTLFYNHFDFRAWVKGKKNYLASCVYFQPNKNSHPFHIFRPIGSLQKRIDSIYQSFGNHTIGIHIRRTDNIASITESPTELFINRIQEEIAQEPNVQFYLASDSEEDKRILIDKFGKRIITSVKKTSRNSLQGMQDALVELYVLSKTKKILGSMKSSFSETAAQISGIPCELLKKTE